MVGNDSVCLFQTVLYQAKLTTSSHSHQNQPDESDVAPTFAATLLYLGRFNEVNKVA